MQTGYDFLCVGYYPEADGAAGTGVAEDLAMSQLCGKIPPRPFRGSYVPCARCVTPLGNSSVSLPQINTRDKTQIT